MQVSEVVGAISAVYGLAMAIHDVRKGRGEGFKSFAECDLLPHYCPDFTEACSCRQSLHVVSVVQHIQVQTVKTESCYSARMLAAADPHSSHLATAIWSPPAALTRKRRSLESFKAALAAHDGLESIDCLAANNMRRHLEAAEMKLEKYSNRTKAILLAQPWKRAKELVCHLQRYPASEPHTEITRSRLFSPFCT